MADAASSANKAESEADRAGEIVEGIGNPVREVKEVDGKLQVTKADGSQNSIDLGYLPLAGGTVNGNVKVQDINASNIKVGSNLTVAGMASIAGKKTVLSVNGIVANGKGELTLPTVKLKVW